MKMTKTNAARLLDTLGIQYDLIPYTVDEHDLSAVHLAKQLNQEANQLFKTLVLRGDKNGYFVCLVPGAKEVNLKKAAKASGNKNCSLIPLADLLSLTGYIRGGCSPLGMKKHFSTYIDASVYEYSTVFVSAGQRGLQIQLAPVDLLKAARAQEYDLV